jgi:hypothetical protein
MYQCAVQQWDVQTRNQNDNSAQRMSVSSYTNCPHFPLLEARSASIDTNSRAIILGVGHIVEQRCRDGSAQVTWQVQNRGIDEYDFRRRQLHESASQIRNQGIGRRGDEALRANNDRLSIICCKLHSATQGHIGGRLEVGCRASKEEILELETASRGGEAALRRIDENGGIWRGHGPIAGQLLHCTALGRDEPELVVRDPSVTVEVWWRTGTEGGTEIVVGVGALDVEGYGIDGGHGSHGRKEG